MSESVSDNTQKVYGVVLERLNKFCRTNKIKDKFSSATIEVFVTHLHHQLTLSHSTIQSNLSAIRHHCHVNQIPILFDTPRLKLLLRGMKKSSSSHSSAPRQTNKVSKQHLYRLCSAADVLYDNITARMYKAMFTIAFFGLLRPSEVASARETPRHQLRRKCVRFGRQVLMLTFFSYKHSDQSVNVKVDKLPDTYLCPWNNMYNYLSNSLLRAEDPLFPVTTVEFTNVLSGCAEKAGIKSKLTPHAFRRGGATWFSCQGMTDARLKAYGRWSSNAYLCYVKAD